MSAKDIKAWQQAVGATPDGKPGPATFAATVAFLRARGFIAARELPADARARVVAIAKAELGEQDPRKYYADAAPQFMRSAPGAIAWCGVFALWCLRQAGLTDKHWVTGSGFAHGYLPIVSLPEPGDIAYYRRLSHYAIVSDVGVVGGRVELINGNGMASPREGVTLSVRALRDAAAYYSIKSLG